MKSEITGTIVGGALQLDERIDLPDNSRVRVAVEPLEEWRAKFQTGLEAWRRVCQQRPVNSGGRRFTRDELHERH